jgi:hypothetical protein
MMAAPSAIAIVRMKFLPRYRRIFCAALLCQASVQGNFPGREGRHRLRQRGFYAQMRGKTTTLPRSTKQSIAPLAGAAMDGLE